MHKVLALHHFYFPDDVAPIQAMGMGTPKPRTSAGGLGAGKRHRGGKGKIHA